MRLVAIGDFHIPTRASSIPSWISSYLSNNPPDAILCTGDLETTEIIDWLKTISTVYCVRGNMDWLDLPKHSVVSLPEINIGLIHGDGIHPRGDLTQLYWYSNMMNVPMLVHGHTHKLSVDLFKGKLFVNPGTATGSWGGSTPGEPESFVEIIIKGRRVKINKYLPDNFEGLIYEFDGRQFIISGKRQCTEGN